MAEIEIKGMDKLIAKLQKLPEIYKDAIWDGAFDVAEKVEGYAVRELQSSVKYGTGELARSIKYEVVEKDGKIVGRIWSDSAVAWYRTFGTGLVGEASPKKLPDGFEPSYRQTPWFIPADKVDVDLNAVYGMPKIKINGKTYYRTKGQPARQFFEPAIEKVSDEADTIVANRVNQAVHDKLGG